MYDREIELSSAGYVLSFGADIQTFELRTVGVGVAVAVMAPTCTPYGPGSYFNHPMHDESWLASYLVASPHGKLCGQAAAKRLQETKAQAELGERRAA